MTLFPLRAAACCLVVVAVASCRPGLRRLPIATVQTEALQAAPFLSVAPREAVQLAPTGGAQPYTFVLRSKLSGDDGALSEAGLYMAGSVGNAIDEVTIGDSLGAVVTTRIQVGAPLKLSPNEAIVAPGERRSFEVSGGKPPYTSTLQGDPDDAVAGSVLQVGQGGTRVIVLTTVDALGAAATAQFSVGGALILSALSSTQIFPRETVVFAANYGTPPYSYSVKTAGSAGSIAPSVDAAGNYRAGDVGDSVDIILVTDSHGQAREASVQIGAALALRNPVTLAAPGVPVALQPTGGRAPYALRFAERGNRSGGSVDANLQYVPGLSPKAVDRLTIVDAAGSELGFSITVDRFGEAAAGYVGVDLVDFDNDGVDSLVLSRLDRGDLPAPEIELWDWRVGAARSRAVQTLALDSLHSIGFTDINGDGAVDLVASTKNRLQFHLNDFSGRLSAPIFAPVVVANGDASASTAAAQIAFGGNGSNSHVWRSAGIAACSSGVGYLTRTTWAALQTVPAASPVCTGPDLSPPFLPIRTFAVGNFNSTTPAAARDDLLWVGDNRIQSGYSVDAPNTTANSALELYSFVAPVGNPRNVFLPGDFDGAAPEEVLALVTNTPQVTRRAYVITLLGGLNLISAEIPLAAQQVEDYRVDASAGSSLRVASAEGFLGALTYAGGVLTYADAPISFPFSRVSALTKGDVNGDGVGDVVVYSRSNSRFAVMLGDGDGAFDARAHVAFGQAASSVFADLDGDGNTDALTTTTDGRVAWLQRDASGFAWIDATFSIPAPRVAVALPAVQGKQTILLQDLGNQFHAITSDGTTLIDTPLLSSIDLPPLRSIHAADFGGTHSTVDVYGTSLDGVSYAFVRNADDTVTMAVVPVPITARVSISDYPGYQDITGTGCQILPVDFNADGIADLAATCTNGFVNMGAMVELGDAGGTFVAEGSSAAGVLSFGPWTSQLDNLQFDPFPRPSAAVRAIGSVGSRAVFAFTREPIYVDTGGGDGFYRSGTILVSVGSNTSMTHIEGKAPSSFTQVFSNADALADLAVNDSASRLRLFTQNAGGTFTEGASLRVPGTAHTSIPSRTHPGAHDIVLRGKRDVVILQNDGAGNF